MVSSSLWFHSTRIHVKHFPHMTIEVLKTMPIHEPVILRFRIFASTCCNRFCDEFIHLAAALAGKRYQHLGALGGIRDRLWRELLELWMSQQHDVCFFAHDHASTGVVRELLVELKTEFSKKIFGLWQIFYRKVY